MDKHKIYTKLKDENIINDNEEESNIYFSESIENKDGIIEENQRIQMATLKELYHNRILNKIDCKASLNEEFNISKLLVSCIV